MPVVTPALRAAETGEVPVSRPHGRRGRLTRALSGRGERRARREDCWRLRRCAGCVTTSRWVRRDGALGVAPGGKAVMGPAQPCATSAGSTRSPPFSATLAADSGSFRIATEAQVAQRAQAAATTLRAAQRVGPRCTSATVACGFPVAEDVVAPLWQAREKRDSAYVAQSGWSCRELRGSDACRSSSVVGLFSILGLSYSYGLTVLRNLQYQVLRVHATRIQNVLRNSKNAFL